MISLSYHVKDIINLFGKWFGGSRAVSPRLDSVFDPFGVTDLDMTGKVKRSKKIATGGYSDVWTGKMRNNGQKIQVVIKELHVRTPEGSLIRERLKKRLFKEISMRRNIQHLNVVPFLGYIIASDGLPSMISLWCPNGNVVQHLQASPETERMPLVLDAAHGLCYLHSLSLVHGDIKGENILVDGRGTARLCDFGMSKLVDEALHMTGLHMTDAHSHGTPRYLSPELLDNSNPKTTRSDIWAFACVMTQMMTDQIPYHYITNNVIVTRAIDRGNKPYLDESMESTATLSGSILVMVYMCWEKDPRIRPDAKTLLAQLLTPNSPVMTMMATPPTAHAEPDPRIRYPNTMVRRVENERVPSTGGDPGINTDRKMSTKARKSTNRSRQPQSGTVSSASPRAVAPNPIASNPGTMNTRSRTPKGVKVLDHHETSLSWANSAPGLLPNSGVKGSLTSTNRYHAPRQHISNGRRPLSHKQVPQAALVTRTRNIH